jgi:hypothetical protein
MAGGPEPEEPEKPNPERPANPRPEPQPEPDPVLCERPPERERWDAARCDCAAIECKALANGIPVCRDAGVAGARMDAKADRVRLVSGDGGNEKFKTECEDWNAYLGFMKVDKYDSFDYWAGMSLPENTFVPEGFDLYDFPKGALAGYSAKKMMQLDFMATVLDVKNT